MFHRKTFLSDEFISPLSEHKEIQYAQERLSNILIHNKLLFLMERKTKTKNNHKSMHTYNALPVPVSSAINRQVYVNTKWNTLYPMTF